VLAAMTDPAVPTGVLRVPLAGSASAEAVVVSQRAIARARIVGAEDARHRAGELFGQRTVVGDVAVRLCGLYLPNGNPAPGPKFDYKLAWMDRLHARAKDLLTQEMPALMAGDYNIIPQAEDAARPDAWREDALFRPDSRAAFRRIVNLGFTEGFRARTSGPGHYSFWDYQAGAWNKNDGIRIDHILMTPQCADLMRDCYIEKDLRGREKPSDHVPVWVDLAA
jgi:exodeoxyribonuclease-3